MRMGMDGFSSGQDVFIHIKSSHPGRVYNTTVVSIIRISVLESRLFQRF